jgi:nitroreductase
MKIIRKLKGFLLLIIDHLFEICRFIKYSSQFSNQSKDQIRSKITFYYHSLEKGFLNDPMRSRFGAEKIKIFKRYLYLWVKKEFNKDDTQFQAACSNLLEYVRRHEVIGANIADIISKQDIAFFENLLIDKNLVGGLAFSDLNYFAHSNSSFEMFSNSRHSVRHFSSQLVDKTILESAVKLSRNAPSVCNRQAFRILLIEDQKKIQEALKIQGGLNATASSVRHLFVVMVDRSYFVAGKEWYQGFIDGGIYLQNFLYCLHFYKVAAVPLNWSKHYFDDKKIEKVLGLNKSLKVIAMVAAGTPNSNFLVPKSKRKSTQDIFEVI